MSAILDAILDALLADAALIGAFMLALWLVSLAKKDVSIVDVAWGLGFTAVAWRTWWSSDRTPQAMLHATLLAAMVTTWGVRLALYIAVRNRGRGEDVRYQRLRAKYAPFWWKSLFIVFGLQGVLLLVVALPVEIVDARPVDVRDAIGVVVFVVGFLVEAIADLQMALHKRAHAGVVMDRGLWRWSRHPNYFGELVLWWGIGIASFSMATPWTLLGPATISFLLLRVSGVPMLEAAMRERPGYADYVARTSSFFPRPPRSKR